MIKLSSYKILLQMWFDNLHSCTRKASPKNIYGLAINNLLLFTFGLFRSLNNFYDLFLNNCFAYLPVAPFFKCFTIFSDFRIQTEYLCTRLFGSIFALRFFPIPGADMVWYTWWRLTYVFNRHLFLIKSLLQHLSINIHGIHVISPELLEWNIRIRILAISKHRI